MSIKAKNTVNKHSNELTAIAKCILKKKQNIKIITSFMYNE